MIEVKNISKKFNNNVVLNGIDLNINKGDVVAIIGPSGTGKSTFLRCLNRLEKPESGSISIGDLSVDLARSDKKSLVELRKKTSMVFQGFNLFSKKTALENVMEGLIIVKKMDKKKAEEIAREQLARNQEAYEEAYHMVFNRLDWLEERLADRRYLFGDKITESDVRLYVTLARFDVAYHNIFRVNKKRLRDYDNLWAYARDLYQTPGFGDTTDFAAIKKHYHIDCNPGNIHQIIAKGPDEEAWLLPHGREKLSEK